MLSASYQTLGHIALHFAIKVPYKSALGRVLCADDFLQRLLKIRFSKNLVRIDLAQHLHIEPFPYPGSSKLTPVALDCAAFRRGSSLKTYLAH